MTDPTLEDLLEATPEILARFDLTRDHLEVWISLRDAIDAQTEPPFSEKVLTTLSDVSGMMLAPDRWDEPYSPWLRLDSKRSAMPQDLAELDIEFLQAVNTLLPQSQLRARTADVLFVRASDKSDRFRWARSAAEDWIGAMPEFVPTVSEIKGWRRGAEIAQRFRLQRQMESLELIALTWLRGDPNPLVARELRESGLGRKAASEVAELLSTSAASIEESFPLSQYLGEAVIWAREANEPENVANLQERVGDAFWREAKNRRSDSHLVARGHYGDALAWYQAITRSLRSPRTLKRVQRLPRLIREEGVAALDEMISLPYGPFDMTVLHKMADEVGEMDDPLEALAALFQLPVESFVHSKKQAEELLDGSVMGLFPTTTMATDGRKVHQTDDGMTNGVPTRVWAQMMKGYLLQAELIAVGFVAPALVHLANRWKPTVRDFQQFAAASPFVSPNMEALYARALHNGFYGRFTESLMMLAPATESCVRWRLQAGGVETRTILLDDTEIEPALGKLLADPEIELALDEDLIFNLKALYTDPLGGNLRNKVAHGLLSIGETRGPLSIYAWWVGSRLALVPYVNAMDLRSEANDQSKL